MILFLYCVFLVQIVEPSFSTSFPNCKTIYTFSKVCHHYKFELGQECVPWNLTSCKKLKTTYNQFKCPKYICVSFLLWYVNRFKKEITHFLTSRAKKFREKHIVTYCYTNVVAIPCKLLNLNGTLTNVVTISYKMSNLNGI